MVNCGKKPVGRLTLATQSAVPARIARRPGRTRRMVGRHGRAGDAPPDRASTAVGVWTRAVTSARLDRLHQVDGALREVWVADDAVAFAPRFTKRRSRSVPLRFSQPEAPCRSSTRLT